ncbi:SNase-domain-containing protein [Lepidopterella palustris CBS 459.81]|uniref:Probable endonuclease LCL3 n=1 Tax=Lepidopterella palustris CBS 459.81 TaxID=1314670 RepID=A0A8E2JG09_9PEZI|nr:SNase-domain-containing protein [Lepidopterella palustris CBS 459.81]
MRWPWPRDQSENDDGEKKSFFSWSNSLKVVDWSQYTEARTVVPSVILTITTLTWIRVYKSYLRRIPSVDHIKPEFYRRRGLFGKVTSVGDADNFRLFHTPGGRLAGWGWLPWKTVPSKREDLTAKTIHIRIAGVDAPELAHFGRPAQPYSQEALEWLTQYISNRRVRAYIYRRDQYNRVVAMVCIRKWFITKDVGMEMLKRGLATVYEAKSGSEFGKFEKEYRQAEEKAKRNKVGMWSQPSLWARLKGEKASELESPRDYKTRMTASAVPSGSKNKAGEDARKQGRSSVAQTKRT